jgi:autotransporter-associated beta strand protein
MLLLVASCDSVQRRSTTVDATRRRDARTDSSEQLSESIVQFSNSAAEILADDAISNSYSHQRLLGARKRLGEPLVRLESTDAHSAFASTDCSGWLSFALNTVSPLHEAVLQSQRRRPEHNRAYSADFALRERWRPWSRSFVVTQYLRADYAETTGFEPVTDFEELQPGDIGAYAMGRYAKPSDESRPKPKDTGHVFIVVGPPIVVDRQTEDYDGRGTLSEDAAKVIAVAVVDSSATLHFDPDSRKDEKERYSLPTVLPHSRAKPGGVGAGTIWFALSEEGRVLQRRLGLGQRYRPVLARAARLRGRVSLDETILDDGGALLVKVFENSPSEFGGLSYGDAPIDLTGEGGLRLASGRLVLNGHSDFSGGVTVESGELIVGSSAALGAGDVAQSCGRPAGRGAPPGFPGSRCRAIRPHREHHAPVWNLGRTRVSGHVCRPRVLWARHPRACRRAARGLRSDFRRIGRNRLEETCVIERTREPALTIRFSCGQKGAFGPTMRHADIENQVTRLREEAA